MFIPLNMLDRASYNEDTENETHEATVPCIINTACIRCFYPRRQGKPGTRITFNDGGGFAVSESPEQVAILLGAPLPGVLQPANDTSH